VTAAAPRGVGGRLKVSTSSLGLAPHEDVLTVIRASEPFVLLTRRSCGRHADVPVVTCWYRTAPRTPLVALPPTDSLGSY
jgi:hypothetical protein